MAAILLPKAAEPITLSKDTAIDEDIEPVYVWDLIIRLTHWTIVLSMIVLAITGVYLGGPFVAVPGRAGQHFVTGWVKVVHFYGAIAFSLAVGSRIVWMFLGPRTASWKELVPIEGKRRRALIGTALFYGFFRPQPPSTMGHNPLAGLTYCAVFTLYLTMIATGLALYSIDSYSYMHMFRFLVPLFHGAQGARWVHHVVMWLLIGFSVHHVFSAILVARVEKNGCLDSIFSGYKFLRKDRRFDA